jgi:hypothetical protein
LTLPEAGHLVRQQDSGSPLRIGQVVTIKHTDDYIRHVAGLWRKPPDQIRMAGASGLEETASAKLANQLIRAGEHCQK